MRHTLGDLQHAIMKVLWERGAATTAAVHEALHAERGLALTTIATMLRKLEDKGVVAHTADHKLVLLDLEGGKPIPLTGIMAVATKDGAAVATPTGAEIWSGGRLVKSHAGVARRVRSVQRVADDGAGRRWRYIEAAVGTDDERWRLGRDDGQRRGDEQGGETQREGEARGHGQIVYHRPR